MTKDAQIKLLKARLALAYKRIDILEDELASERAESISKTRRASRDAIVRGAWAS